MARENFSIGVFYNILKISLIEIGSKTAEKNSAQTNKQTDKPTDTTKIMVTWP